MNFPKHIELHLTHNQHVGYYETVAEAIEKGTHGYDDEDWVSEEQKQKAIQMNECWTLQWYPSTPVGFLLLSAADLDVLLLAAEKAE